MSSYQRRQDYQQRMEWSYYQWNRTIEQINAQIATDDLLNSMVQRNPRLAPYINELRQYSIQSNLQGFNETE